MRTLAVGLFIVAFAVTAHAAPGDDVTNILTFLQCLNENIAPGEDATVVDSVQCIPSGCTLTLTMSDLSAQAACSLGGEEEPPITKRCQLPRVLLNCPGPPGFMPSYLLCPEGSAGGSNRIEVGVVVGPNGRMQMADVVMAPGPYETIGLDDVLSVVADSKGCNEPCHANGNPHAAKGQPQLSLPIDPFGRFGSTRHLNLRIIATDEPGRVIRTSKDFTAQSLSEVCSCIEEAVNDDLNPISGDQGRIVLKLCQALDEYQMNRGVCAGGQCP